MNNAIEVSDVVKVYRLYDKPIDRLKESIHPMRKNYHKDFYALDDISFNVEKGSTVGIIGTNGSGKSTILKIITGVLNPSSGSVKVNGTISALLELGAGFNMEYNGIENIYMNGTMMGFTKAEMDKKLHDILDFADIGDFVHQPVKTYSSGMFVRLAFALAINVEPDILIVDEALSVGDVFFQAKCYTKMEEIRKNGTTILMVTHDMGSIIKYCDKAILLNRGKLLCEGEPHDMVDAYKKLLAGKTVIEEEKNQDNTNREIKKEKSSNTGLMKDELIINSYVKEYGSNKALIYDFGIIDSKGDITGHIVKGEYFTIREKVKFNTNIEKPIFTYTIKDKKGLDLSGTNTLFENADISSVKAGDEYIVEFRQKMDLQGGDYLLSISCTGFEAGEHVVYHRLYDVTGITVISQKDTVGIYDMNSEVSVSLIKA